MGTAQGKVKCIICLEKHVKGITCENSSSEKHFVCDDCFAQYVGSVLDDAGKLMDADCKVRCPDPGCTSLPWTSVQLRKVLTEDVMEKYLETLAKLVRTLDSQKVGAEFSENDLDHGVKVIVDSLTLGCPGCKMALDPNPDGCSAMRCGHCSRHFCLLCFKVVANSSDCHAHVRVCPQNTSGNVFTTRENREAAHKRLQILSIQQILRATYGSNWQTSPICKTLIEKCRPFLTSSKITPENIFATATVGEGFGAAAGRNGQNASQHQPQQPQVISNSLLHLCIAFGLGLFTMYFLMSFTSRPPQTITPLYCPVSPDHQPFDLDNRNWNYPNDESEMSYYQIDPSSSSPSTSSSSSSSSLQKSSTSSSSYFSFWSFGVYVAKGLCYALAANYFTKIVEKVPLVGILIVFLWYPSWRFVAYIFYLLFLGVYFLNFSINVLLTARIIILPQERQEMKIWTCLALWFVYMILNGIKSSWIDEPVG